MNTEIKEKWVVALRSGDYKQGKGRLRQDGNYCCLGVLCDVINPGKWRGDSYYGIHDKTTPYEVDKLAGLTYRIKGILTKANDSGSSFEEIAKVIEDFL
jgi:hypothetical protein